jgi:hypothetical protein
VINNQNGRGRASVARSIEKEDEVINNQNTRGGSGTGRGSGFGRGKYVITCSRCRIKGHEASKCPESRI